MAATRTVPGIFQELADSFASGPSRKQLLNYRPSKGLQGRAQTLLAKQDEGRLTEEERQDLDEFLQAETLMRLVKAKIRAKGRPSRERKGAVQTYRDATTFDPDRPVSPLSNLFLLNLHVSRPNDHPFAPPR